MVDDMLAHLALLLLFPPLLPGVVNKVKALFAGRTGPPLLQPYYDLIKLMRKSLIVSRTATWVFPAGPIVTLAATIVAGLLVPFGRFPAPLSFTGDPVLFAYLFGLARFFTTGAALDTGSSFEGMGASREVSFSVLTEPALFFAFLVLARHTGSLSLTGMLGGVAGETGNFSVDAVAPVLLIVMGLFIVLLAESSRIPVDDPSTHLELTMIHEVMVLDHSGPLFGIVLYASAMKLFVVGTVLLDVAVPFATGTAWLDRLAFAASMLVLAVVVGVVESIMARLRMRKVPYLLVSAVLLCGSAFVLSVR